MASEQFSQAVRGSGGVPVATNTNGTVETDNYSEGGTVEVKSSDYPETYNPPETIQELGITSTGEGIVAELTTTSGTTFNIPLNGTTLTLDTIEIDELVFRDPSNSGIATEGWWAGE
jgi:hypothetical protein